MTCEQIQRDLEDLFDGELTARRAGEVRAHLAACPDCQEAWIRLAAEESAFAGFRERAAIEPSSAMWATIRERIRREPAPDCPAAPRLRWWGRFGDAGWRMALRQVAFAVLLMTLSITGALYLLKRDATREAARGLPTPPPTVLNADRTPAPGVTPTPTAPAVRVPSGRGRRLSDEALIQQQIARAEREYQGAVRLLERAIARRRDSLDPTVTRQYESSLALIDSSIRQSRAALRANPNDLTAGHFMLAAYARKIELMRDIALPWD
ncbi:MAG: hypothetical protein EBZ36_05155 [Acidobacteria bacterium]|nr:hypothetical protein [Acidobacteriota bacterium]